MDDCFSEVRSSFLRGGKLSLDADFGLVCLFFSPNVEVNRGDGGSEAPFSVE